MKSIESAFIEIFENVYYFKKGGSSMDAYLLIITLFELMETR